MDTSPFDIEYIGSEGMQAATIHPCCKEDNIVDYAVWQHGKLVFTITKDAREPNHWVIALKNADDEFDEKIIQKIGEAIQHHQTF